MSWRITYEVMVDLNEEGQAENCEAALLKAAKEFDSTASVEETDRENLSEDPGPGGDDDGED